MMDFKNLRWYRRGMISVPNGGVIVNGIGTNWLEADIKAGDVLFTKDMQPYEVAHVPSSTELTLATPYRGETLAGEVYFIIRRVPAVMQAEIANRLVTVIDEWDKRSKQFGVLSLPITIPATGWTKDLGNTSGYPWHVDIPNNRITEDMTPFLTVLPESLEVAQKASFSPTVQTIDGALRVFAKSIPTDPISGTLALFSKGETPSGGGDGDVEAGDGLVYGPDGRLAVRIGNGLTFDENRAVAADPQTVVTEQDMVNEDEAEQNLRKILLDNATNSVADEPSM